ncbi:cobalamin-dependent protein [Nitrosopumilus sp.]|nr:cobalamin-dependent protein [Nitrosopumilus sp.]MDC0883823.1 cobalamin-dependent protein [Nitrosopumilus sp.]
MRTKSIRGQKYLYLVESQWDSKKKTSKQNIIKYLGIESNVSIHDVPENYQNSKKVTDYFTNQKYFQPTVQNEITEKLQKDLLLLFQNGNHVQANSALQSYENIYGFESFLTNVLTPLIQQIESLGISKNIDLGTQTTCYNTIQDLMNLILENNDVELKKKKILICVPYGEQHTLGTKVLESQLVSKGNIVYNLAPFTPASSILESIELNKPDCVFISVTLDENMLSANRMVQKINDKYNIPIILGGQAVKSNSKNQNVLIGQHLSITKILKLIQYKKFEIIPQITNT